MIDKKFPLIIVRRRPVTDSMLVDTNVTEDDYSVYDENETYALGAEVIVLADHGIYVSAEDGNTGNAPLTSPNKWKRRESTNRWRAFDGTLYTRTTRPELITYQLRPGKAIGCVGVLNLVNATSVQVEVADPVYGVVMNETCKVGPTTPAPSWWHWFFGQRTTGKTQALFLSLPTYPNADVTITIQGGSALGVGEIMVGQSRRFGYGVQRDARAGIVTYSTVQRDIDGRADIKKRPPAKRNSFTLTMSRDEVDQAYNFFAGIESEPVLVVASERYETFSGYGLVKNFEVIIPDAPLPLCSFEFDGMT